jgi:hypothetical protein
MQQKNNINGNNAVTINLIDYIYKNININKNKYYK